LGCIIRPSLLTGALYKGSVPNCARRLRYGLCGERQTLAAADDIVITVAPITAAPVAAALITATLIDAAGCGDGFCLSFIAACMCASPCPHARCCRRRRGCDHPRAPNMPSCRYWSCFGCRAESASPCFHSCRRAGRGGCDRPRAPTMRTWRQGRCKCRNVYIYR